MTGGVIGEREADALAALNETLRDDYVADCQKGVDRWNRSLAEVGKELTLPHVGFNRAVGVFAATPRELRTAALIDGDQWASAVDEWLPTAADREFVESLMVGVSEPGVMAGWLGPPSVGIHAKPADYEYVRL